MENFQAYIVILKILQNTCTQNNNFLKMVWTALLSFVKKPSLFGNLTELFAVDKLHITFFKFDGHHVQFDKDRISRQKAK